MVPQSGEAILFHGHPSWRSILGFYVKGLGSTILLGAVSGVVSVAASRRVQVVWVAAVMGLAFATLILVGRLKRLQTTYRVTDHRLTVGRGLLSHELHETRLERILTVNATQSALERMLRVGSVDFGTAGGVESDFCFSGVANPREIIRTVDRALHERSGSGITSPGL